jgi:outer membrane receptor protein involved in Fe transport
VTLANNELAAERSTEYEGGVSYRTDLLGIRGSYFHTSMADTVANVTLSTTPSLITRQRRNAGRTVSRGIEIEFETKIDNFTFSTGYLFADSTIRDFPSNNVLVGKRIAQVPTHQATFQFRYSVSNWTFSSQTRASDAQFDDDLNTFRLEPYFQADGFVSYRINEKASAFVAIENIFNSRYSTAKTPVRSVSGPVSVRVGIRWN